jgi:hypothetical protein
LPEFRDKTSAAKRIRHPSHEDVTWLQKGAVETVSLVGAKKSAGPVTEHSLPDVSQLG